MSTRAAFNSKSPTIKRILQESKELSRYPDPYLSAHPLEENLFEWHFTIAGPPSSPYENGIYHGRIILPPTYPLRPPMFRFTTPSGRFETNREICLSISGHHEETWQPAWGVRTALCAIRAFMESNAAGQLGGLDVEEGARRRIAAESRQWTCGVCATSNEAILRDAKEKWERAKERGELDDSKREQVPDELRLAYKDDLTAQKSDATRSDKAASTLDSSGDVATKVPVPASTNSSQSAAAAAAPSTARTSTASRAPAPTPTRTIAPVQTVSTADGVPAWVDKAIFGVILSLILMLLKKVVA